MKNLVLVWVFVALTLVVARCGKDDNPTPPPQPSGKVSVLIGTPGLPETSYQWSPAALVSDPKAAQTWAFPTKTTVFSLEATTKCGSAHSQTTVKVFKRNSNGELVEQK